MIWGASGDTRAPVLTLRSVHGLPLGTPGGSWGAPGGLLGTLWEAPGPLLGALGVHLGLEPDFYRFWDDTGSAEP